MDINQDSFALISRVLKNLNENQRKSFVNVLRLVAQSDSPDVYSTEEIEFIEIFLNILEIEYDDCVSYFDEMGLSFLYGDLKKMELVQKHFLIFAIWDLINCDVKLNEKETMITIILLEKIGVTKEEFSSCVVNMDSLMAMYNYL